MFCIDVDYLWVYKWLSDLWDPILLVDTILFGILTGKIILYSYHKFLDKTIPYLHLISSASNYFTLHLSCCQEDVYFGVLNTNPPDECFCDHPWQ